MESVARFCDWLSATPISQTLQSVGWIVPTVQSIHIMAIAMVIAPAIHLNLRLLGGRGRSRAIPRVFASLSPLVWWALLALLLSGGLLITAEPRRALLNSAFQSKMALLIAAVSVTAGLQRWAATGAPSDVADIPRPSVRLVAFLSLVLWIAIIGCGRWIAYVDHG